MSLPYRRRSHGVFLTTAVLVSLGEAQGNALRVATYNINADSNTGTGIGGPNAGPGLETVLEAFGKVSLNDNGAQRAQPIDVLALQELHYPSGQTYSATLQFIVNNLNATYGPGTYAFDTTNDPTDGNSTGNGPSGLIYNTRTVRVVGVAVLGTASSSGAPRAPIQYQLQPLGYGTAAQFYVDVSHMKSTATGSATSDANRRNVEATTLVNNDASLGASAHVLSVGDFNIGDHTEAAYQTMITKFTDVANRTNDWSDHSTAAAQKFSALFSEKPTADVYRDDIQFVSPSADPTSATATAGLQYMPGSMTVFGNFGAASLYNHSVADTTNNPGTFNGLNASDTATITNALTTATDHLPVVADYNIVGVAATAPLLFSGFTTSNGVNTTNGNWDLATYNFTNNTYTDPSQVVFGDADGNNTAVATGNVIIQSAGVTPGSVTFSNNTITYTLSTPGTVGIGGSSAVALQGSGVVNFTSGNTYSGGTVISSGTLRANNGFAAGHGSATGSNSVTVSGGTFGGNGSISGPVILNSGAITAGADSASTGNLVSAGGQTWSGGARYLWKINDATGAQGGSTGWDDVSMSSLTFASLTSAAPFKISLQSLNGGAVGVAAHLATSGSQSWIIADTGQSSVTIDNVPYSGSVNLFGGATPGALSDLFTLDPTQFFVGPGQAGALGQFALNLINNNGVEDLQLVYVSAPEPGSLLLGLPAAAAILMARRRRNLIDRPVGPAKDPDRSRAEARGISTDADYQLRTGNCRLRGAPPFHPPRSSVAAAKTLCGVSWIMQRWSSGQIFF